MSESEGDHTAPASHGKTGVRTFEGEPRMNANGEEILTTIEAEMAGGLEISQSSSVSVVQCFVTFR